MDERLKLESQAEVEKISYNFSKRINEALESGSYSDITKIIISYAAYIETNLKIKKTFRE
jgi:hypothetical protein